MNIKINDLQELFLELNQKKYRIIFIIFYKHINLYKLM